MTNQSTSKAELKEAELEAQDRDSALRKLHEERSRLWAISEGMEVTNAQATCLLVAAVVNLAETIARK